MQPGIDGPESAASSVALLEPGKKVSVHGVVTKPRRKERRDGPPLIEADLMRDHGSPVTVVWWEETEAPVEGVRISVTGTVYLFGNKPYVSVEDTRRLRPRASSRGPGAHPHQRLLRYLYECVEAESGLDTILDPKDDRILALVEGRDPAVTRNADTDPPVFLTKEAERRWFQIQRDAGRDSILLGYPVVVGTREEDGVAQTRLAPLFLVECEWSEEEHGVRLWRKDRTTEELAPGALELIGLGPEERERFAELIDSSSHIAEGTSPRDRLQLRLNLLQETRPFESIPAIDPEHLSRIGQAVSVFNSIVALPFGRSPYVRSLLLDLAKLADLAPGNLESGPLGSLLRCEIVRPLSTDIPEPTVLPSNYSQDLAVAGSRKSVLTVVTGPPGTGKSQMIVNAVAAAVCAGETVLVASKNNQAVDVVHRRFRTLELELPVIRTGNRAYRQTAISAIEEVLNRKPPDDHGLGSARVAWDEAAQPVRVTHRSFAERRRRLSKMDQLEKTLDETMRALPQGIFAGLSTTDPSAVLRRIAGACGRPPFYLRLVPRLARRWRAREVIRARDELAAALTAEVQDHLGLEGLASLSPSASVAQLHAAQDALERARALIERAVEGRRLKQTVEAERAALPGPSKVDLLEREIARGDHSRRRAGLDLVNAAWRDRFKRAHGLGRTAAWLVSQHLKALLEPGTPLFSLPALAPRLLDFLPAWLVSSLSVRGTFPLEAGLFDLLIVDEASQGDVASLVPLLYRAKRAMIVGDAQQLTHVTRLSSQRAKRIADELGLDPSSRERWNYVTANAFSLAARHVEGPPAILEQHFRSHPAIIEFCNGALYNSALVVCTDPGAWADRIGLEWVEVSGVVVSTASGSRYNDAEAQRVAAVVAGLREAPDGSLRTFGIVSPYRAQTDLIQRRLRGLSANGRVITVGTAHSFQGDERDVMIYSPVISGAAAGMKGLLGARPQLVNVAISRAVRLLVIVGDRRACLSASSSLLKDLAQYSLSLEGKNAHSPFEIRLAERLECEGAEVVIGGEVEGHRAGLLVRKDDRSVVVECNGHPFDDASPVPGKDAWLEAKGAKVLRFSPRHLRRDLPGCAGRVLDALAR